jgi:hypothetical protein
MGFLVYAMCEIVASSRNILDNPSRQTPGVPGIPFATLWELSYPQSAFHRGPSRTSKRVFLVACTKVLTYIWNLVSDVDVPNSVTYPT